MVTKTSFDHDYADAEILRLAAFFRSNSQPILVCSPDGEVCKTNPAAAHLLKQRLIATAALLPANHQQIVSACLNGHLREHGVEISVNGRAFALTYHPLPSFKMVYLVVAEKTPKT